MGSRGIGIWQCVLFSLSLIILLVPAEQANALFTLPAEPTEKELFELNKQEQLLSAEELRDYILDFQHTSSPNPYHDANDGVAPYDYIFKNYYPEIVRDESEIKQEFNKIMQLILAQETLDEIQQGKTITNIYYFEPVSQTSFPGFEIDDQTGHMKRSETDFQAYKLEQITLSEQIFNELTGLNNSIKNNNNQEMKHITISPDGEMILEIFNDDIITRNLIKRTDTEFKNLIIEQTTLAELTRDQVISTSTTGMNPFLIEDIENIVEKNVDENVERNVDDSSIKTNTGLQITWSDPTYVTDKPELNLITRNAQVFGMVKAMEIEIAQNILDEMLMLSNSEKITDKISEDDRVVIINGEEIKIPKYYERGDPGFEFFKQAELDKAKAKLLEMYG